MAQRWERRKQIFPVRPVGQNQLSWGDREGMRKSSKVGCLWISEESECWCRKPRNKSEWGWIWKPCNQLEARRGLARNWCHENWTEKQSDNSAQDRLKEKVWEEGSQGDCTKEYNLNECGDCKLRQQACSEHLQSKVQDTVLGMGYSLEGERHKSFALENSPPRRSNKRRERTFKDECLILFCKGLIGRTKVAGSHFSVSGDKRSTPGLVTRRKGRAGLTPGPQTQSGRVP